VWGGWRVVVWGQGGSKGWESGGWVSGVEVQWGGHGGRGVGMGEHGGNGLRGKCGG